MSVHSRQHKPAPLFVPANPPLVPYDLRSPHDPQERAIETKQQSSKLASPAPATPQRTLKDFNPRSASPACPLAALRLMIAHRRNPAEIIPRLIAEAQALQVQDAGELRRLAKSLVLGMGGADRLDGRLCHAFIAAACEAFREGVPGASALQDLASGLVEAIGGFGLSGENARVVVLALQACHEPEAPQATCLVLDVLGLALCAHDEPAPRATVSALLAKLFGTPGLDLLFDPGKPLLHAGSPREREELQARMRCVALRAALERSPETPDAIEHLAIALVQLNLDKPLVGKAAADTLYKEAASRLCGWPDAAQAQFRQCTVALRLACLELAGKTVSPKGG